MAERIHLIRIGYGYAITGSLTPAGIGVAYSRTLTAIGGVGTKRLEIISENVTDAITFTDNGDNTATFGIADPQAAGTYTVTVRATDADRQRWTRTFTLDVVALPLTLSGSLADMTVGSAYSDTITVTGGVAPYEFYPIESFPAGITKSLAGGTASPVTVSGTPTGVGLGPGTAIPFTVTFIVQDAVGAQAIFSQSVTVNVAAVVCTIDGGALPDATDGVAYSHDVDATGGTGGYTYTKQAGPSWLSVNSSTGAITGTPATGDIDEDVTVTVRATDSEGNYADVTDTIDVLAAAASWATLDPVNKGTRAVVSNGNMRAEHRNVNESATAISRSISGKSAGKAAFEAYIVNNANWTCTVGICDASQPLDSHGIGGAPHTTSYAYGYRSTGNVRTNGSVLVTYASFYDQPHTLYFECDFDAHTVKVFRDNVEQGTFSIQSGVTYYAAFDPFTYYEKMDFRSDPATFTTPQSPGFVGVGWTE